MKELILSIILLAVMSACLQPVPEEHAAGEESLPFRVSSTKPDQYNRCLEVCSLRINKENICQFIVYGK